MSEVLLDRLAVESVALEEKALMEQDQQHGYFARIFMAGREAVGSLVEFSQPGIRAAGEVITEIGEAFGSTYDNTHRALRYNKACAGGIFVAAFSAAGAIELAIVESRASAKSAQVVQTAEAAASHASKCERYVPNVMNPSEVSQAIDRPLGREHQSVAEATIKAVQRIRPSERQISHTDGETVTDVSYVAELAGAHSKGTYLIEAYSKGRLSPKNIRSVELTELPGTFTGNFLASPEAHVEPRYDFLLQGGSNELTKSLAPGNRFYWEVNLFYGQKKNDSGNFWLSSTTAHGYEMGNEIELTQVAFNSVGSQFVSVVEQAEDHKPISFQRILPSLSKLRRTCD